METLKNVQKKLGCPRAALGSLSEAASVFDAERLKEIIAELGAGPGKGDINRIKKMIH